MSNSYPWKFCSIGGATRVRIISGEDIAHLGELDQKLWTALSCPTTGLEFNQEALNLLDDDHDGHIRVREVIAASEKACRLIKNKDLLLEMSDTLDISEIDTATEEGQKIYDCAKDILTTLGKTDGKITLGDASRMVAKVTARNQEDWKNSLAPSALVYGDKTAEMLALVEELGGKMAEYFSACKFKAYNPESPKAKETDDFISHPDEDCLLHLDRINPVWAARIETLKNNALSPEAATLSESQWNDITSKFGEYKTWLASKGDFEKKGVEAESLTALHNLLILYRYLYSYLNNYVLFGDFYNRDKNAVFDAGELYIDQRCLKLCIRVSDMAQQTVMAPKSGMYILYCDCVSKSTGKKLTVAAILTNGDIDNLYVGRNAVFYDRNGLDYDAVVTKIIDNPTSVRQAFFHPYKKLAKSITDRINKKAAEKEAKVDAGLEAAANKAPEAPKAESKFDIAKFAGIFAALGMGVGVLASALANLISPAWKPLVVIAILVILISGPSMFLAWLKLRKRDLGPLLNANGWAINSSVIINTVFGATLTSLAKYPKVVTKNDPYAIKKKHTGWWILLAVVLILGIAALVMHMTGTLHLVTDCFTNLFSCRK